MQFFRYLHKRGFRAFLIVLLVGSIFAFGHTMTPRGPHALAKVFLDDIGPALNHPGMPAFMNTRVEEGAVQEVFFNGNQLYYTLNRTDKSPGQLIEHYANMYKGDEREIAPQAARDEILKTVANKADRAEHARQIDETEKILNQHYVSFEGEGYAGFAQIVTGKEGEADWQKDTVDRIRTFKETGKINSLGDPKVMVAFEDPSQGDVQYFNVWPGKDFDMKESRPKDGEDTPGYDVEDIQRPHNAQRLATFAQEHMGMNYEVFVYKHDGQIVDAMEHWYTEMNNDDWAVSSSVEKARAQDLDFAPALLFSKDSREAFIALRKTDEGVTSTVVVHTRG
jgi:hypothetical protein